jgi:hypothetical protein
VAALKDFDRRWIFLAMGAVVVGLYASKISADLPRSPYVDSFYETIEELPPVPSCCSPRTSTRPVRPSCCPCTRA